MVDTHGAAVSSVVARGGYARRVSTLFRLSQTRPILILGRTVSIRLARWITRLWIVAVIVGSLLPGDLKEKIGTNPPKGVEPVGYEGTRHRVIHVCVFGSSYFLLSLLAWNRREELQAAGEVLALGCLIELLQDLVYAHGKVFEWWDLRDDAIGIAVAFFTLQLIHRMPSRAQSQREAMVIRDTSDRE